MCSLMCHLCYVKTFSLSPHYAENSSQKVNHFKSSIKKLYSKSFFESQLLDLSCIKKL